MTVKATAAQLQELYIAYFGRAADPTGLEYWEAKGVSTEDFAATMYAQNEFKGVYGDKTVEAQVNQIYKNLFNRTADAGGLTFWVKQINLGVIELASIANELIWNVNNDHGGADDKATLAAKTAAATAYTAEVKKTTANILNYAATSTDPWVAGANITEGVTYINSIDKDTAHTAATITASLANFTSTATGKSYTLGTAIDNITGTSDNDTIYGANGTTDTFTTPDVVDGGAGTDILDLVLDTGAIMPIATVKNVETLRVKNTVAMDNGGNGSIDLDNMTSVTKFIANANTQEIELDNVDTRLTAIEMQASKDDLIIDTGDATDINLTINDVTSADDVDISITEGTTAITTLNISSTQGDSTLAVLDADEVTTSTFTGNGGTITVTDWNEANALTSLSTAGTTDVTFSDLSDAAALITVAHSGSGVADFDLGTALAATVTSITATGSGAIKATSGSISTNFTGGSGNDEFQSAALVYSGTGKIDGGAGTGDILSVTESTATIWTDAAEANISNFEILKVGGGGTDTFDFADLTGLTGLIVDTATAATISNVSAGAAADVDILGVQTTSLTISVADSTDPGTIDTVKVNLDNTTDTTSVTVAAFTSLGTEHIHVNSTGAGTNTNTFDLAANNDRIQSITITGDSAFTLTDAGDIGTEASIDATALTGTAIITVDANTSGMSIKGSATAVNTITGGTGVDIITGGSGNDLLVNTLGIDTIDCVSGNDTVQLNMTEAQAEEINRVTIKNFDVATDSIDLNGTAGSGLGAGGNDSIVGGSSATTEWSAQTTAGSFTVADPVAVLELSWEFSSGVDLDSEAAGSLSGTNLLAAMGATTGTTAGTISTAGQDESLLVVAYQDGDALIYHGQGATGNVALVATEISLIATIEGVAVGALTFEDII